MAMTLVGISSVGSAPLPICDVESSSDDGNPAQRGLKLRQNCADARISSTGRVNARSVGIASRMFGDCR